MKTILLISIVGIFYITHFLFEVSKPKEIKRIIVGDNIRITSQQKNLHHVEADFTVNPSNPNHWLAAAIVIDDPVGWKYHCATWASDNGGESWIRTDFQKTGADPKLLITDSGKTYLSCLGKTGDPNEYYYISNDGGLNWNKEYKVQGGHDHPTLSSHGKVAYWWSTKRGNRILDLRKSIDGTEFEPITSISFSDNYRHDNMQQVILSDGTLILPYSSYQSDRRGVDTKGAFLFKTKVGENIQASDSKRITEKQGNRKGMASMLIDRTNSRFKDNLYYIYALGENESFDGIGMSISVDKGETWKDIVIQDGRILKNKYYAPTGIVNNNGVIGIYWYDRRNDLKREKNDIYFTASIDGGKTFLSPVRVTEINSKPDLKNNERRVAGTFPGGGHYSGISILPDGSFQLVWSDSRSGIYQLYTSNVKVE